MKKLCPHICTLPAGACEGSLACSTCHVIVEVCSTSAIMPHYLPETSKKSHERIGGQMSIATHYVQEGAGGESLAKRAGKAHL